MKYLKRYKNFENSDASSSSGMGGVSSAQPGGLPGTTGTVGSGDIPFYLNSRNRKRKKGNPSQVSDLRDLAPAKTNKINESFTSSLEYNKLISKLGLDDTFIMDSLEDIKSMSRAKVNLIKYISNSKGHMLGTKFEDEETYVIKYVLTIRYTLSRGREDINYKTYSTIVEDLGVVKMSIDEMIDRCSEKLKLSHNNTVVSTISNGDVAIDNIIHFNSDEIDKSIIKKSFDEWSSERGPEFEEMLKKLRRIYDERGIDFDTHMDTNDSDEYILVGVFPPDEELYGVGEFNKVTKKWTIDMSEIMASFRSFDDEGEADPDGWT